MYVHISFPLVCISSLSFRVCDYLCMDGCHSTSHIELWLNRCESCILIIACCESSELWSSAEAELCRSTRGGAHHHHWPARTFVPMPCSRDFHGRMHSRHSMPTCSSDMRAPRTARRWLRCRRRWWRRQRGKCGSSPENIQPCVVLLIVLWMTFRHYTCWARKDPLLAPC